jgi:very-short-patch-repair endonuclease
MAWLEVFRESDLRVATTAQLRAAGATSKSLEAAVDNGFLVRARRGHYVLPGTDRHILEAVRLGGRLGCISALADDGVFAFDASTTHVHVAPHATRLRSPHDRFQRLNKSNRGGVQLHWDQLADVAGGSEDRVGLPDALIQSFRCQEPRFALASLDNALHLGLLRPWQVPGIFAELPERLRHLEHLVDGRSEAGQETVLRLLIHHAGWAFDIQVQIGGVGRVDIVVEGCVAVEADSRAFHDGWDRHVRDRARDRDLAIAGYSSYRALYRDIMYNPDLVVAAIAGLLAANSKFRTFIV